MMRSIGSVAALALLAMILAGCATSGSALDPVAKPATLAPDTKTGIALDNLPPPTKKLDVAVYALPDLTGQNKPNDNFAEFSRALTQGGAQLLTDALTRAGNGEWFDVVERTDLQTLLQERQIIQKTRAAVYGEQAAGIPPLRFAGVILDGAIVGYDSNETTGGLGANYLGIGGNTEYRHDIVTVALRAVSVSTGRVLASVTTAKTVYSVQIQGSAFRFAAVDELLQIEGGITHNAPTTLAVKEGIELGVYALIFEGVKKGLWQFADSAAGAVFMRDLEEQEKAMSYKLSPDGTLVPAADMGQMSVSAIPSPRSEDEVQVAVADAERKPLPVSAGAMPSPRPQDASRVAMAEEKPKPLPEPVQPSG